MKSLFIFGIALVLVGCSHAPSREELAARDDEKCRGYGAAHGSQAYIQCRTQLDAARTQALATYAAGAAASGPTSCQRIGNTTTCY